MSPSSRRSPASWSDYLDGFHARHPGITEDVLSRAVDGESGRSPYDWLLVAAPAARRALDVACGSGPVAFAAPERDWVGVDRSADELARATTRGLLRLVRGDATTLPFPDQTFDLVTCSMGIMLFDRADVAISEFHRLLSPGGTALLLLPGTRPLSIRDRLRYLRLLAALREPRPTYPNDVHLFRLRESLRTGGFEVVSDGRRRFRYPLPDEASCRLFAESLYAPGRSAGRVEAAHSVAVGWVGSEIGIPLRRVVCRRQEV